MLLFAVVAVTSVGTSAFGFMMPSPSSPISYSVHNKMKATVESSSSETDGAAAIASSAVASMVLDQLSSLKEPAQEYAETFGLDEASTVGFYGLFSAMRKSGMAWGFYGVPFVLKAEDIQKSLSVETSPFAGFFTMTELEQALSDDFLDAARGSTDNRKGWKVTSVSNPRGDSFEEARMTYEQVLAALEKGTVIFNAAGAHIPRLAGPCLACCDATSTPNALNIYVTAAGKRTSAPPHTDKQDVVVVQTSGKKYWRIYAPTDPANKPSADPFARGKMDDNLPLYQLDEKGSLLLEVVLEAGDILFVPAGFPVSVYGTRLFEILLQTMLYTFCKFLTIPTLDVHTVHLFSQPQHTTGTAMDASEADDTSLHLTFNVESHVWDLDYLSARRFALRRACVTDTALGQSNEEDNRYVGRVNELPEDVQKDIYSEIPLGFLDEEPPEDATVDAVTAELIRISKEVDTETANTVDESVWKETVVRLREQGMDLLEIHRDMYLAALEEGTLREEEDAITAHLDTGSTQKRVMTPERMQRLSLFRVQRFYEKVNDVKAKMVSWSYEGKPAEGNGSSGSAALPADWAFTMPVKVGDQVEADLGGAFFPATVSRVAGTKFDVQFFDGDRETGLDRSMIKLLVPPKVDNDEVDTSNMTPKQLKRWKKQQEKKNKK